MERQWSGLSKTQIIIYSASSNVKKFPINHFGFKIAGFWGFGMVFVCLFSDHIRIILTYAHVLVTCSTRRYLCVHAFQPSSPEKNYININQIEIQETKVLWKIRKYYWYCHIIGKNITADRPGVIFNMYTETLWLKCWDVHFYMWARCLSSHYSPWTYI